MMRIITAGEACKRKGPSKSACTGDCAINDNGKCDNNYGKMQLDAMGDCAKENPMMKSLLYESACGECAARTLPPTPRPAARPPGRYQ